MHEAVCADCGKTVKFYSSLIQADLFTVEIAIRNEDH